MSTTVDPDGDVTARDAAPIAAAHGADVPAARFTRERARQNGIRRIWWGVVFVAFFLVPVLTAPPGPLLIVLAVVLAVVAGAGFLAITVVADLSLPARWAYVIGYTLVITVGSWPVVGSYGFAMAAYGTAAAASLLPLKPARIVVGALGAVTLLVGALDQNVFVAMLALVAIGAGLSMAGTFEQIRIGARLARAEERIATLAVVAERERIGRDLHDILGHSLTAITVKTGLAGRLLDRDTEATRTQLSEIEQIARQALSDVRATAGGFREIRLGGELAGARSVLQAAGIQADTPAAVPALDDVRSELFGYAVREAITNVVRHSRAGRCVIRVDEQTLTVADDGIGIGGSTGGNGLRGLGERVSKAGGRIAVAAAPEGMAAPDRPGTMITVHVAPAADRSAA